MLDDKHELKPLPKFIGQLFIAVLVAAACKRITLFVPSVAFSYAITILWVLTVVNAFNFMDNMNGLCAGLGAIGAWQFAVIAAADGEYLVAIDWLFSMCGALVGFLPWNFPNARAFLGDAGSHLVGYLLAVLAILPHFYTKRIRIRLPCSRRCSCWPFPWPTSHGSSSSARWPANHFILATPTTSRTGSSARD